jgi:NAD(P)-dependent dehydrogenase (short-subunit alcohol dehydrogenase family)
MSDDSLTPRQLPGAIHRFGTPLEIADLVLFLASPASDFICGQIVFIDGGYTAV